MTTTFEIKNSKDYYNLFLLSQYKDFSSKENYNSSRHAVAGAMFAYHQREWIWKNNKEDVKEFLINNGIVDRKKKSNDDFMECKFNEYVNSNCPEFRTIREVCNGTKHLTVQGNIKDTFKRNGAFNGGFDGKSIDTNDLIIVDGSNILIFKEILNSVIKFWEKLFSKLKI